MDLTRNAERELVAAFALVPQQLAPELAQVTADYRGQPLIATARAYVGPAVAYARFVSIESPFLRVANALIVPKPTVTLPLLGIDVVCIPGTTTIIALDASPTDRDDEDAIATALGAEWSASVTDVATWAKPHLSRSAFVTRTLAVPASLEAERILPLTRAYASLPRRNSERPHERAMARDAYLHAHRDEQNGMKMVMRLLGRRYVDEVLFPKI